MSTIGHELDGTSGAGVGGRRFGYWRLVWGTLIAVLLVGSVMLVPVMMFMQLRLFPSMSSASLRPFSVDGVPSLVAALALPVVVGWLTALAMLVTDAFKGRQAPNVGWLTITLAVVIYGCSLLGALPLGAVFLAPPAIWLIAYRRDGKARTWPLSRRVDAGLLVAAVVIVLGFGATHTCSVDGAPMMDVGTGNLLQTVSWESFHVDIQTGMIATDVRSASVVGTRAGKPISLRAAVSVVDDVHAGAALALPRHFTSQSDVVVSFGWQTAAGCPAGQSFIFNAVKLRYSVLGLPATMTVPVASTAIHCPR